MKIALLTFHNAANYGAALQTYALQKFLQNQGHNSIYIDYVNENRSNAYNMKYHILNYLRHGNFKSSLLFLLGSPFMNRRKKQFKFFFKKYVVKTPNRYTQANELIAINEEYERFIVGSDQVWNPHHNGADTVYLLDFVTENKKKVSYSSSFGLSEIPIEFRNEYSLYLNQIKHLSTREEKGVEIIKELTGRKATLVLDPVFLLSKKEWCFLMGNMKKEEEYIFSYTNLPGQFESFVKQVNYPMKNIKHYKLSSGTHLKDFLDPMTKVKYSMSPIEFLEIINNSKLVITASFHCLVLSIILNKPFIAILKGDAGKDERLISVLRILGLEERIFSNKLTLDIVNKQINWNIVNERIDVLRKDSIQFLNNALN